MMNKEKAVEIFGELQFTFDKLKKRFRQLSPDFHPDTGGSTELFNDLQSAYKLLKEYVVGSDDGSGVAICGTKLSEFGKGYPITESAKTCDRCNGKGYTSFSNYRGTEEVKCDECNGVGLFSYVCRRCGGTGDYVRRGKKIGECRACNGSGRFYPEIDPSRRFGWSFIPKFIPGTMKLGYNCKKCGGDGTVSKRVEIEKAYRKCDGCEGVGELKMWNPVLPRGLFNAMKG